MYFWYQMPGSKDWQIALASQRQSIVSEKRPQFVTALDADTDFTQDMTWEEASRVKYLPAHGVYFDFDSETPADTIPHVKAFSQKLKEYGVDLNTVRFFLSGGKGFHIEIPLGTFKEKVPKTGIAALPYIYKEVAYELAVPCLDFLVYTGRRGRMWRTPNVERDNGGYKVPVTEAEVMEMTPERYTELIKSPRPLPPVEPAKFCGQLGVLFALAEKKVTEGLKKRKGNREAKQVLAKFKTNTPDDLKALMQGEDLIPGVSFQRVAMQLAIAAISMGWTQEKLIAECEGLCRKHNSDGTRYHTYETRRRELRRMYEYMDGNPFYEFSVGALKVLSTRSFAELRPHDEYTPDPDNPEEVIESEDQSINKGIKVHAGGIFVKTDDGFKKASDLGMSKPVQLIDNSSDTGDVIGYEVDVYVSGVSKGRQMIRISDMQSKQRFQNWTGSLSASTQATDNQVALLMDTLRKKTMGKEDKIHTLTREGLDLVVPFGSTEKDVVWSARDTVKSRLGHHYRLAHDIQTKGRSDLIHAPLFTDTPEARETLVHLMNLNSPRNMAVVVGWHVAAHMAAYFRHVFNQFPLLGVYGPSGAGKSTTIQILSALHTYKVRAEPLGAGSTTQFSLQAVMSSSSSIPIILDEYKPQEWDARRASFMREIQRNSYTGASMMSGRVNHDSRNSLETKTYALVSPLIILAEALETETAVRERTVELALTKESRMGFDHESAAANLIGGAEWLSRLGHSIASMIIETLTLEDFKAMHLASIAEVRKHLADPGFGRDRPIFNQACCLTGYDYFTKIVAGIMGDFMQDRFAAARASLLYDIPETMPVIQSEMSKALGYMAEMSYGTGIDETTLYNGRDYVVKGDELEINVRFCYTKYRLHMGRLRLNPAYPSLQAFEAALKSYGAVTQTNVTDSPIKMNALTRVIRLSVAALHKDSVDGWKGGK